LAIKDMMLQGIKDNIYSIAQLNKLKVTGLQWLVDNNRISLEDKSELLIKIDEKIAELEVV